MNNSLLELRNVTRVFKVGGGLGLLKGRFITAVDNVSFEIPQEPPTIKALVGESGSGKTTIARMVLGLLKPTSGEIFYKGRDVSSWLKKDWRTYRHEVQAIFQDPYSVYNPIYKVDRVLRTVIKKFNLANSKEEAEKLIIEGLEAMGLRPKDVLGRYPHQLSGGERQRLMLVRIFLVKPKLIIADEPVSMIDVSLRAMFLDALKEFKHKYGISCLYITHDLNITYYIADNIEILCRGRIVERGDSRAVIKDPLHPYTRLLMESIPNPDPSKRWESKLEAKVTTLEEFRVEQGCVFYHQCKHAMPICKEKIPPLIDVKQDREVACFLYEEKSK